MSLNRLGPFFAYIILTLINYYGFKKLQRLKPNEWHTYEGNSWVKWLLKKVGLEATQILTVLFIALLLFYIPQNDFLLGCAFALFVFNAIHDYIAVKSLLEEEC